MAIQKISANDDLAPDFETFGVMKKIAKQTLYSRFNIIWIQGRRAKVLPIVD